VLAVPPAAANDAADGDNDNVGVTVAGTVAVIEYETWAVVDEL
jgi:hypothetical protein